MSAAPRTSAINFGGGVNFNIKDTTSLFFEVRYHYVWGPEVSNANIPGNATLKTTKANGQFLPITVGFRF